MASFFIRERRGNAGHIDTKDRRAGEDRGSVWRARNRECQEAPGAGRKRKGFFPELSEQHGPADTLISVLRPEG